MTYHQAEFFLQFVRSSHRVVLVVVIGSHRSKLFSDYIKTLRGFIFCRDFNRTRSKCSSVLSGTLPEAPATANLLDTARMVPPLALSCILSRALCFAWSFPSALSRLRSALRRMWLAQLSFANVSQFRQETTYELNCLARIPVDIMTLMPGCPGVKEFLPIHRRRRKSHFLVWASTIFGADVHDPKGSRKTVYPKKELALLFGGPSLAILRTWYRAQKP